MLQRARTYFFAQISTPRRALFLGEGDGRGLAAFLKVHPCECLYVDASMRMTELARHRCGTERVHFQTGDVRKTLREIPSASVELVVCPFILDVFTSVEVQEIYGEIDRVLSLGGKVIVSDFATKNWRTTLHVRILYGLFSLLSNLQRKTLPNLGVPPVCQWELIEKKSLAGGLVFTQLLQKN